ncbi:hypothetical protein RRG08_018773 [Elysia crispata]|uniref:Uncharacterized protein n=1 Tax=Elysia crispata TaxID=231223 RepID=A0AAE0ZYD5_9GAST|nr:hypothetical protein RRG08_018773 [Elysia crispata]
MALSVKLLTDKKDAERICGCSTLGLIIPSHNGETTLWRLHLFGIDAKSNVKSCKPRPPLCYDLHSPFLAWDERKRFTAGHGTAGGTSDSSPSLCQWSPCCCVRTEWMWGRTASGLAL